MELCHLAQFAALSCTCGHEPQLLANQPHSHNVQCISVFPFLYFIHTSIILFQSQFFPSTLHLTAPSLLPNLCHYRQPSPYSLSPQHFCDFIAVLSSVAICPFLSSVAEAEAPGRRLRLERWEKNHLAGARQPSIFLPAVPSFTLTCSSSLSLPLCLFSISVCLSLPPPPSLFNTVFSQGWKRVMALLSPLCHSA